MSDCSFTQRVLNITPKWLQRCLADTWLVPWETAAVSAQVLCTPYNHAPAYSVTLSVGCMCVTCHLHVWQTDRDFLRATAVTRVWDGYRNNSQHRKLTLEKNIYRRRSCRDSNPKPQFRSRVRQATTELSPLPTRLLILSRVDSLTSSKWIEPTPSNTNSSLSLTNQNARAVKR